MMLSIFTTALLVLTCAGAFLWFEKSGRFDAKHIAVIATLSALAGAFRIPFAMLPNIQPTTFLVMVSGIVFGPISGFITGAMTTLVSNAILGHGPWTPWQMLAWGLSGTYGGLIAHTRINTSRIGLALHLFLWGFLFDYIMNLWHFAYFISPHTLKSFIAVFAASFFFDLSHAVGNACFAWIFGAELIQVLIRFKRKINSEKNNFERKMFYD